MAKSTILFSLIILLSGHFVSAQNNQEFEIYVNGNLEKISPGKKNIFITSKGDTIVYEVENIINQMIKDQPKVSNTGATATNYTEPEINAQQEKKTEPVVVKKEVVVIEKEKPVGVAEQKEPAKAVEKVAATIATKEPAKAVETKKVETPKEEKKTVEVIQQKEMTTPPATIKVEPVKELPKQKSADAAEIEKLKEEAQKKTKGNTEPIVLKDTIRAEVIKAIVEVEKKKTVTEKVAQPVKSEKAEAVGTIALEEKKVEEVKNVYYVNKKYYLENRNVLPANINSEDTLQFIATFLSVYKDFPSLQFGSEGDFSFCYNYVVKRYNGYDEDLIAQNSSIYKVCNPGKWNDKNKTAEMNLETNSGKGKTVYSIVQLDDKKLVLVKR